MKRSTGNSAGIIVFSVIAALGLTLTIIGLVIIGVDMSAPESAAKGLTSLFISFLLFLVVSVLFTALFLISIFILNLRMPNDIELQPSQNVATYRKKLLTASMGMFVTAGIFVLIFVYCISGNRYILVDEVVSTIIAVALVPVFLLSLAWAFTYLARAAAVGKILTSKA